MKDKIPTITEDKAIPKTVTMYSDQWDMVDEVDQRYGFRNISSALRFILNDYRRLTGKGKSK